MIGLSRRCAFSIPMHEGPPSGGVLGPFRAGAVPVAVAVAVVMAVGPCVAFALGWGSSVLAKLRALVSIPANLSIPANHVPYAPPPPSSSQPVRLPHTAAAVSAPTYSLPFFAAGRGSSATTALRRMAGDLHPTGCARGISSSAPHTVSTSTSRRNKSRKR